MSLFGRPRSQSRQEVAFAGTSLARQLPFSNQSLCYAGNCRGWHGFHQIYRLERMALNHGDQTALFVAGHLLFI